MRIAESQGFKPEDGRLVVDPGDAKIEYGEEVRCLRQTVVSLHLFVESNFRDAHHTDCEDPQNQLEGNENSLAST